MAAPFVSIVVPTRDRSESVRRLLRALSLQPGIEGAFEVIVVADGCSDSTVRHVREAPWPFPVHVLELPPSGPSVARNCGASLAAGEILLFLDDDVEPEPGLVRAHAKCHAAQPRSLGLGYLPPVVGGGLFGATLRAWWEGMFDGPRRLWHRYTYRDLLTGNFSIERADFEELGGFDPELRCHEDWEFGFRAIRRGFEFRFLPAAAACHYDVTDLRRSLRRKCDEGVADVQLARKHPELIPALPLGRRSDGMFDSKAARLAWQRPRTGDRLLAASQRLLAFYERWNLRFRWRALLDRMLVYSYWRGVAAAVGSRESLADLLIGAPGPEPPEFEVDLAAGIDAAARLIESHRPRSVRVVHGSRVIGDIPDVPGAERLRSVHLRRALARELAPAVAGALAAERGLPACFVSPAA